MRTIQKLLKVLNEYIPDHFFHDFRHEVTAIVVNKLNTKYSISINNSVVQLFHRLRRQTLFIFDLVPVI